ncbi:MAG: hypothetical protein RJA59_328, partial [Pseudomonadota bacterium]
MRKAAKAPPRKPGRSPRPRTPEPRVPDRTAEPAAPDEFPIVGLGASAGGLEAFEQFFRSVPVDLGMAFVLVSHLDPSHESILTEILQRATALPVVEAHDQLAVKPGHIYVIPPNRDMTIFHGVLQLSVPDAPRGQRMPIDAFFRSLAEDRGDRAIAVVLSGTGSDGTMGLRAIVGEGGVTFVQDPATAAYDGMPSSAIRSGFATHVLPVERMPEAMRVAARTPGVRRPRATTPSSEQGLTQVLATLRSRTGHDFSQYKRSTVVRRVDRRMAQHDIADVGVYARFLKEHPAEVQLLFRELLINVTSFFRDREAFEALRKALPSLFTGKPEGWAFRAWIAVCATGEEAYSVAILVRELMEEAHLDFKVQIYATDLDDEAIAVARAGTYPQNILQDVTTERLRRFFVKEEAGYRIKKEIREMVVFAVQDVIRDPPFTRLDLLSCRNLMIYLEPELQERLLSHFHYALRPGGLLLLSPSESTGHDADRFKPIDRKWKLFRVVPSRASAGSFAGGPSPRGSVAVPAEGPAPTPRKAKKPQLAELAAQSLLQAFAPPAVVTDRSGEVLYVHGDTGRYLRPAPGHATLNVIELARPGLQAGLRQAFRAAAAGSAAAPPREATWTSDGRARGVRLAVRPLGGAASDEGLLLVTFQDAPPASTAKGKPGKGGGRTAEPRRVAELERALADVRDLLRTTVEEQQASTEEQKSMNEELQSTNEELQSTNEELETSKEELQSVNEELVTVNAELQAKIEQLAGMQNDMRNLLDNVNVG